MSSKKCKINYKYKYNKDFSENYWNDIYNNSDNDTKNELKKLSKNEIKKLVREYIIEENLRNKIINTLPKCSLDSQSKYNICMNYCNSKLWNKYTNFNKIGYHATSIENYKKITKNGFFNNSLFTCDHIRQSIQVGERLSDKYIILLCLFNIKNIVYNLDKFKTIPFDYNKLIENLKKNKIDGSFEGNTLLILNPNNISIFGFIVCEKNNYCIHYY
jgi:hypothetical protein